MTAGKPGSDLGRAVPGFARRLRPGDDEKDDRVEVVERDRRVPRQPELSLWIVEQRHPLHAKASTGSRLRCSACPRTTAITISHAARATFFTQNDRKPFQAKTPVSVSPAKPAGTRTAAISTLKCPTQRANTGWSCWSR